MEKLVGTSKVKSMGISNFTIEEIEELLKTAKITPAVNQIEAHPWLQQPNFFDYLKSKVHMQHLALERLDILWSR